MANPHRGEQSQLWSHAHCCWSQAPGCCQWCCPPELWVLSCQTGDPTVLANWLPLLAAAVAERDKQRCAKVSQLWMSTWAHVSSCCQVRPALVGSTGYNIAAVRQHLRCGHRGWTCRASHAFSEQHALSISINETCLMMPQSSIIEPLLCEV